MNKIIGLVMAFLLIFSISLYLLRNKDIQITNNLAENSTDKTKIVFFGLGKADSIYIENSSKNILIDAGLESQRGELLEKLKDLNVKKLDYMILTHGDKDHIGAASYILDNFQIGQLIQSQNIKDTKRQKRIDEIVEKKQINNVNPTENMEFSLGDLEVTIFVPKEDSYKKDNDYSLITLIKDRGLNYLFAADAEKKLLKETLELDLPLIDLYKVPHHGRKNSNSKEIIEKIKPKYSIITNFPEAGEISEFLENEDSEIKYVYEKDLLCISDGEKIEFY